MVNIIDVGIVIYEVLFLQTLNCLHQCFSRLFKICSPKFNVKFLWTPNLEIFFTTKIIKIVWNFLFLIGY